MAGMLQMRRSRGAFSGFLLMLLGLWGALIPFIGPYFDYAYSPDKAWTYNTGRLWLEILPGAAVFLGGFLLMVARGRHTALFGALLAAAAGGWFALGTVLSPLWNNHMTMGGAPAANTQYMRIMEQLGFFSALGAVIMFIAAVALGRIASVASGLRGTRRPGEPSSSRPLRADRHGRRHGPGRPAARPARRCRPGPGGAASRRGSSESEETRPVPAQDTTGTVGSGTIQ